MSLPFRRPRRTWSLRGSDAIFPSVVVLTTAGAIAAQHLARPVGLWVFVVVLGGWIIGLCLHEFAHAVVALGGGDTSVRGRGYLRLNPVRYTDPVNSLAIPVILLAIGGIPLPGGAVLTEPWRYRYRYWAQCVAAAGPLTHLLLGLLLAACAAPLNSAAGAALSFLAVLAVVAAILNALPVPGFDGWTVFAPLLPKRLLASVHPYQQWAPLLVFALLWGVPGAARTLFDAGYWLTDLVGGNGDLAAIGASLFQFWR